MNGAKKDNFFKIDSLNLPKEEKNLKEINKNNINYQQCFSDKKIKTMKNYFLDDYYLNQSKKENKRNKSCPNFIKQKNESGLNLKIFFTKIKSYFLFNIIFLIKIFIKNLILI